MERQDDALRTELLERGRVDQEVRSKAMSDWNNPELTSQMIEIDQKNTARMRQIVKAHGWPG
jgi:hypothetical protein